jgi:hypothetical protein
MTMRDPELRHIYQTTFGHIELAPSFITEADKRWPDRRCTKNPKWEGEVANAIAAMIYYDMTGIRKAPKVLRSVRQIEKFLELH